MDVVSEEMSMTERRGEETMRSELNTVHGNSRCVRVWHIASGATQALSPTPNKRRVAVPPSQAL